MADAIEMAIRENAGLVGETMLDAPESVDAEDGEADPDGDVLPVADE